MNHTSNSLPKFQHSAVSVESSGNALRFRFYRDETLLSWKEVLTGWQEDDAFLSGYIHAIGQIPYRAFRWETPAINCPDIERGFEFVVTEDPGLDMPANGTSFAEWFDRAAPDQQIVVFPNLGGDATMVVPLPGPGGLVYSHFAVFHRQAPQPKVRQFWKTAGKTVVQQLGKDNLWLNSAGGGVPWLHLRLDSRPKYYVFHPYRDPVVNA